MKSTKFILLYSLVSLIIIIMSACKKDSLTPPIDVVYEVKVDGLHLTCEPLAELPLAQRYFLF